MKKLYLVIACVLLSACTTTPEQKENKTTFTSGQKITITGTRIKRSDLPSGPKLEMGLNKKNKESNFMDALALMQTLPQPKDIGDCRGLLKALLNMQAEFTIVNSNKVMLQRDQGIYEYSFDDESCPENNA